MAIISKISYNSSEYPLNFGVIYTCSTASGTVNKAITGLSTSDLSDGLTIKVKFTYSNTVANPKIYVDSSTYTLYRYGTTLVGTDETSSWHDGEIVDISFVASGNTYICYLNNVANNVLQIESERKNCEKILSVKPMISTASSWTVKTWTNLAGFDGEYIWTDGDNIYYSSYNVHYVLNKSTSTWSTKTWSGLTSFDGEYIWTDGDNIYYSYSSTQYVLNKSISNNWTTKTWSGLTNFTGNNIWTDGTNIYYSSASQQYVLDKSTSTWSTKTWSGLTSFDGEYIWTDGVNIYYSSGTNFQYILDKANSTWIPKIWTSFTNIYGNYIWTDGDNIYYSNGATQYVLNKFTSIWAPKTWSSLTNFYGENVWSDGDNIYYSSGTTQYKLNLPSIKTSKASFVERPTHIHSIKINITVGSRQALVSFMISSKISTPFTNLTISSLCKILSEHGWKLNPLPCYTSSNYSLYDWNTLTVTSTGTDLYLYDKYISSMLLSGFGTVTITDRVLS